MVDPGDEAERLARAGSRHHEDGTERRFNGEALLGKGVEIHAGNLDHSRPLLDELHDLPDRPVHQGNAPQHLLDRVLREAGLERERVRGEHIGRVVHAPVEEVVGREPQDLKLEAVRIADIFDVDPVTKHRVYANPDRVLWRDIDHELEPPRVAQVLIEDPPELKGVVRVAVEPHLEGRSVRVQQGIEPVTGLRADRADSILARGYTIVELFGTWQIGRTPEPRSRGSSNLRFPGWGRQ